MEIVLCRMARCIIFGVPRLPVRPCDERPPAMYGHFCLVPRVSVHDRYYCPSWQTHMGPIWDPYGHLYGPHMGFPHGTHMGFANGIGMGPIWVFDMGPIWVPHGSHMGPIWVLQTGLVWVPYGYLIWDPYGVDPTWDPYGFCKQDWYGSHMGI